MKQHTSADLIYSRAADVHGMVAHVACLQSAGRTSRGADQCLQFHAALQRFAQKMNDGFVGCDRSIETGSRRSGLGRSV